MPALALALGPLPPESLEPCALALLEPLLDGAVPLGPTSLDLRASLALGALTLRPLAVEPLRHRLPAPKRNDVALAGAEPLRPGRSPARSLIGDAVVPRKPHAALGLAASEALEVLRAPLFAVFEADLDQGQDGHQDREERDRAEREEGDHLVVGPPVNPYAVGGHRRGGDDESADHRDQHDQQTAEMSEAHAPAI